MEITFGSSCLWHTVVFCTKSLLTVQACCIVIDNNNNTVMVTSSSDNNRDIYKAHSVSS